MPSYREILNGILKECRAYEQHSHQYGSADVSERIEDIWQTIFRFGSFGSIDNEIEGSSLVDPKSDVVKNLLYVHSMNNFISTEMNRAALEKDESKVESLGPFAYALSRILTSAERKRQERGAMSDEDYTDLYRATTLTEAELQAYRAELGHEISLQGYISTTMSKDSALQALPDDQPDDTVPVLFTIKWKGATNCFRLNTEEYSAYHGDGEVLLNDGPKVTVLSVQELKQDGINS